jgi:hypothetical protein
MAYVEIIHNNPKITNVVDFCEENGIYLDGNFTRFSLINYEGNAARIEAAYFGNPEPANPERLEAPVMLRIPQERMQKEYIVTAGNLSFPNRDFKAFFSDEIKKILQHPGYTPLNRQSKLKAVEKGRDMTIRKIHNNVTVWIWCRALGDDFEPGKLVNVTPFLESVTITNTESGGNFSLKLAPIKSKFVDGEGWRIDETSISQYFFNDNYQYLSRVSVTKVVDDIVRWQEYFFHNVISSNDVVFIQFEVLDMEKNRQSDDSFFNNLFISTASLPGRNFDLIGLVDSNSINHSPAESGVNISVGGRDLMKLLIEDGCYFFPLDFASENGGFVNTGSDNPSFRRLVNGELVFFNDYVDRSVEFSLRFVFNLLANIKVCDNRLFQHYPEKVFRYESKETTAAAQQQKGVGSFNSNQYNKVDVEGIWNAIRLVVDPEIGSRRIVDSSISTDSGSLINFVHKVCQDPFIEFYGETFGDRYYFIARKHPFTGKAVKSYIKQELVIDITDDVVYGADLKFDDSEVYSWYRLTPRGNFFGDSKGISLLQFPAIFFARYAEIWGSRPLSVVSNYIDYNYLSNSKNSVDLGYLTEQSTQDLAYIVETHALLPFTRTGTISILGDRRIKKGMFIRFAPTAEIFYVESVTNSWMFNAGSNDRVTNLTVSRGMVERFMDMSQRINYFNIIDLRKDGSGKSKDNNFKVNDDVFDFFNKRQQFILERDIKNLITSSESIRNASNG